MATENRKIQLRGGTLAQWTASNPILLLNEKGIISDTSEYVLGDGVSVFSLLPRYSNITQANKAKLDTVEANAEVNLTGAESVAQLDDELGGDTWRSSGTKNTSNQVFNKTLVKTWEDIYNEIVASDVLNYSGYRLDIILEDGDHPVGDYDFTIKDQHNGLINIRPATDISGDFGIDQSSKILFNGVGGFYFNGNVDVKIRSICIEISANGNSSPFGSRLRSTTSTEKCWFDLSNISSDSTVFLLGHGSYTSDNDTVTGSVTYETVLADFNNGVENLVGGEVKIFDMHNSTNVFTYGAIGKGTVAIGEVNSSFTNNTGTNTITIS